MYIFYNALLMITTQTAFLGVGYVSAIGTALTESGQRILQQKNDTELYARLWYTGGLITCLFWVIHDT